MGDTELDVLIDEDHVSVWIDLRDGGGSRGRWVSLLSERDVFHSNGDGGPPRSAEILDELAPRAQDGAQSDSIIGTRLTFFVSR